MMTPKVKLETFVQHSPFAKSPKDCFEARLKYLLSTLHEHHKDAEQQALTLEGTLALMTPAFQRDNDHWTPQMQASFVQNILAGCRSEITLFSLKHDPERTYLLDGLQRSTAIMRFLTNQLPVLSDVYYRHLPSPCAILSNARIGFNIYEFETLDQAILHYIAMNENISHSQRDIERARQCLSPEGLAALTAQ